MSSRLLSKAAMASINTGDLLEPLLPSGGLTAPPFRGRMGHKEGRGAAPPVAVCDEPRSGKRIEERQETAR